jgi:iron complex outermembrane receptor protein
MLYASASRGFKAGGINPAAPAGREVYDEEHTWHGEGGVKATLAGGRVTATAAVFAIDWQDLQLNLPDQSVPGQFYIANVGGAVSRGAEVEVTARVLTSVDVFGSLGITRARFDEGTVSSGADVGGNRVPNTPEASATLGTQVSRGVGRGVDLYGRAEVVVLGAFQYDDLNGAGQDAFSLANFRLGARGRSVFVEGWVRNAFNTFYVPVAFAFGPLAPSGYIGEPGRPRTFGLTAGVNF